MKKNIIIFGSSGLIGKELSDHLEKKYTIIKIDYKKKVKILLK